MTVDGAGPAVTLAGVNKTYGSAVAVRDLSLEIGKGEFFTLLGPSGCGKTTTLRMVGGFVAPDTGRILIDGQDVTRDPPNRRPSNMVFQQYALFPHLSVRDNVAFGPREAGVARREIDSRVRDALDLVHLAGYADRRPHQLSGGQQQRVALARALINHPSVLLLDEPLGALDLKMRRAMQHELKRIQREVGITFVYVTHDQEEAMTMSDRIVVMHDGVAEQVGTPVEIYEHPATLFVAGFIGEMNVLPANVSRLTGGDAEVLLVTGDSVTLPITEPLAIGTTAAVVLRPEALALEAEDAPVPPGQLAFRGEVVDSLFQGAVVRTEVQLADGTRVVVTTPKERARLAPAGTIVTLAWHAHDARLLRDDATRPDMEAEA